MTASDISPAMVELARAKVGDTVDLSVADMRELPRCGEFDLVWCLDDAVNYLLSGEELEQALGGMRRNLGPEGLLMFDVNALETYRTFFAEEVVVERDGRRLVWRGSSSPEAGPGRSPKPASRSGRSRAGPGRGRPADRAADAPPAPLPRSRGAGHAGERRPRCLEVFGHGEDAVLKQPLRGRGAQQGRLHRPRRRLTRWGHDLPTTVTGVDFVTVFVKDYPAALKFYGEILGLEHSVDYEKIPAGEFETGSLTLQVMDAAAIGREFKPSGHPIALHVDDVEAARANLESKRRRVPRRDDRQRRLPHGLLQRPRRQRPDVPQPLRAARPDGSDPPAGWDAPIRRCERRRGHNDEAGATGLEPATSGVTGRRSNQLSYAPERTRMGQWWRPVREI